MSDRLITIATFQQPVEAAMAQSFLDSEGIPSTLLDETTIATGWMLAGAIGGIKLQVSAEHAERAEFLLVRIQEAKDDDELPPLDHTAIATREIAEDLEAERADREPINQLTDKLFRSTVFGLLFFPLQFYALYLMSEIHACDGKVSPERRWKIWASVLLNIPLMALMIVPLFCALNWFSGRR
jgi:hypothetical protein